MFTEPPKGKVFPMSAVAIAAVAVVVLVVILVLVNRHAGPVVNANQPQPLAPYAQSLKISNIQLSESTSLSGGKSTYVDGHIDNTGAKTITGITVQVAFANDTGMAPQREITQMQLIRIRQPEVDTIPVSHAPIAPGQGADFRLIFENVDSNWNEQAPEIRVIRVETK